MRIRSRVYIQSNPRFWYPRRLRPGASGGTVTFSLPSVRLSDTFFTLSSTSMGILLFSSMLFRYQAR